LFSCKFHNENNSHFTRIIQGEMRMKKLASTRPSSSRQGVNFFDILEKMGNFDKH
jgi:hypothetical protein